jgi:serine/threonine protein kinase
MTLLAAPATTIATTTHPAEPASSATRHLRRRPATAHTVTSSRRSRPVEDRDRTGPSGPAVSRPVDTSPLRGTDPVRVDGCRLVARLGSGGMADVFYARAPTGDAVAVKLLRNAAGTAHDCQREYRLAHTMHPACTAPAIGDGRSTAGAYLATAYLPGYRCGTTVVSTAVSTPMPHRQLWTFGSALAQVLAAVHARGVVHCDVKPSNLLVRGHDVRLIDFGIARYVGERCGSDGTVQCTRGGAAPEQLRAAPATPAVDIFAWGCLLARLAGGVHPFASRSEQEWILRIQSAQPHLSRVPAGLAEVIRVTLTRNPRHRPSAHELAAICRASGDQHPQPVPVPWPRLETPAARRHPAPERRGGRDDRPAGTGRPWTTGHLMDTTVTQLRLPDERWPL